MGAKGARNPGGFIYIFLQNHLLYDELIIHPTKVISSTCTWHHLASLLVCDHFTNGLWCHDANPIKNTSCSYMTNNDPSRLQFGTWHDSSAVMTCAKLWPVWIIKIKIRGTRIIIGFQLLDYKSFWKWVLETQPVTGLAGSVKQWGIH